MSRRQSRSDLAIDLGIARSTDYDAPPRSSRVAPKWRAPRPVTWPPPLPAHRIPGSAPRSAPPNRFHEPVVHAPLLTPYVEPRKSRSGLWLTLIFLLAAGGAGFVLRERLESGVTTGSTWLRSEIPSDLAERPRIAWARVEDLLMQGVSRVRSLVPGSRPPQPSSVEHVASDQTFESPSIPRGEPAKTAPIPADTPVVAVSALPVAAPVPAPAARPAPHARPAASRDVAPSAVSADAPADARPAPVAAPVRAAAPEPEPAPVHTASAPPAAPAPEPGSLDDLIRKTVERESHIKH
jgi:hypothetical protein